MKKIMFNDKLGLTQAVLEGRKTQTRRFVPEGTPLGCYAETVKYVQYKEGEIVAVAQSYKTVADLDHYFCIPDSKGFFNKMFVKAKYMPHRIKITNVHVERLQDISDADCLKEGVEKLKWEHSNEFYYMTKATPHRYNLAKDAFSSLINKICGKGTWERNPWVFVYDFELVK